MDLEWIVSCPEGVALAPGGGEVEVSGPGGRFVLRQVPGDIASVLGGLAHPGQVLRRLVDAMRGVGLARLFYHLHELARRGCLSFSVADDRRLLATAIPLSWWVALPNAEVGDRPHVLSRFACLRRLGNELVLESPLSAMRIHLHDGRLGGLIGALVRPARVAELTERLPGPSPRAASSLYRLLFATGMLAAGDEGEDPALRSWEFHDLFFHSRSREGRHDAPVGTTYHLAGELPPPPVVKEAGGGQVIELHRPDMDRLGQQGPPFSWVVEQRRSVREYAAEPLTCDQLGEFLYRVARIKGRFDVEVSTPVGQLRMDMTARPYPAAGSLYELELYAVVRDCRDLGRGVYHYDPMGHRLERVDGWTGLAGQLAAGAGLATGIEVEKVQVLLVLSARFQRLSWKYSSIAYALTLKNVGVLYQTMYLTATAMGLAPCAVGAGDADLFARVIGSDYYAETSVGEFLLGSKAG